MATWSLLRSSTSAILSTLKTIPCWFAFRLITEEAFAPIQHLWPHARMWSDLWGWTPCHHHGFIFDVQWKLLDTVLFRLRLESSSNGCVRRQDVISASTVTKDNNSIDYSRIVEGRGHGVETERTSLQFPLYQQRKMQISHLGLDFVLLFLHYSKVSYRRIGAWFSRWANRNHDRKSFRTLNEENETFENPFGQSLNSTWHFKLPSIPPEICSAPVLSLAQVTGKPFSYISLITLRNTFSMEMPR